MILGTSAICFFLSLIHTIFQETSMEMATKL